MSRALSVRLADATPIAWSMRAVYRQRLLNAARAVAEYDHSRDKMYPGKVYMGRYIKPCGSPACVLGHYALRRDLQDDFYVVLDSIRVRFSNNFEMCLTYDAMSTQDHFGITETEARDLFSGYGCGAKKSRGRIFVQPQKPNTVVKYIHAFVARKYPEWAIV